MFLYLTVTEVRNLACTACQHVYARNVHIILFHGEDGAPRFTCARADDFPTKCERCGNFEFRPLYFVDAEMLIHYAEHYVQGLFRGELETVARLIPLKVVQFDRQMVA